MFFRHSLFSMLLLYGTATIADTPVLRHDLSVTLNDAAGAITISDRVFASDGGRLGFAQLSIDARWQVRALAFDGVDVDAARFVDHGRIDVPADAASMKLDYAMRDEPAGWPYLVWLPSDGWYPDSPDVRHRFRLTANVPGHFNALTQGAAADVGESNARTWIQDDPQLGIYFVAGPWREYSTSRSNHRARVMLLEDDAPLAHRYLKAAVDWLGRYTRAFGDYPYHAFTLVENRRQTGWGMPGFTLLGSRVIRLPFIIHTSFPHEIAHNWWGNGVFVEDTGHWSEALTTYVSDYLVRETRGSARQYRLDTLVSWHDFAANGNDFALAEFTGRHDQATQAVGYGKGMFVFHMLRRRLGDAAFLDGLRRFYADFRFRRAGYDDLEDSFEVVCDCALDGFFDQWLERTGAPRLVLDNAARAGSDDAPTVSFTLMQPGVDPWRLRVPVRVTHADGSATWRDVELSSRASEYELSLDAPAARLDIDPDFDLFRALADDERAVTFSRVFGAERVAVMPASARFAEAARAIASRRAGWTVVEAGTEPDDDVLVRVGGGHRGAPSALLDAASAPYAVEDGRIVIDGAGYTPGKHTTVAVVHEAGDTTGKVIAWLAAPPQSAARAVERLSHYGRYSYVVFAAGKNTASASGRWRTRAAALSSVFGETDVEPVKRRERPLF